MPTAPELERAFHDHYSEIVAFCRRRVAASDIDEIVGDVFAELWRKSATVEPARLRAWLFGVARNKIANHQRAHRRRDAAHQRLMTRPIRPVHPDPAVAVAERSRISMAVDQLSDADRELLELISWEGLDSAELSDVLDCSVQAVYVRVHRLRERMLTHLDAIDAGSSSPRTIQLTERTRT